MSLLTVAFWMLVIIDFNHNYKKDHLCNFNNTYTYTTLHGEKFSKYVK